TDSKAPGEAKDADTSNVFQLYRAFGSADETAAMRAAFNDGIGWGDAKQKLFERIDAEVSPLRGQYEALIAKPEVIEQQLRDGAQRLRAEYATPLLAQLREAVGLRALTTKTTQFIDAKSIPPAEAFGTTTITRLPVFKQYREADGKFYFKLVEGDRVLLQSRGFDSPKDAGMRIAALKCGAYDPADPALAPVVGVAPDAVQAALAVLAHAEAKAETNKA
ncbi:MAG TPA: tryptophan--tRNA ligase, partial [Luteimonas sp.]|nr:tryptophan--tRNA ligase [Luteimonas sp.]